jgi:glycosyltransferase involved in cell wall biosynthesis
MKERKPLIGLVMIGKNEEAVLPRCLVHALPLIDTWTFCDTGSTDATPQIAKSLKSLRPGRLYRHKWRNFGANLTLAHRRAKGTAKWLLWLHADMNVNATDDFLPWLRRRRNDPDFYYVTVTDGGIRYELPLLMRGDLDWRYVGATHEYCDTNGRGGRRLTGIWVDHIADGANREEKFLRDIELLRPGFRQRDPRAIFYTAQSHACLGNDVQAALMYDLRAELNGWEEERWYSLYMAARLRGDIEGLIEAWRERPWRHEPLSAAGRIVNRNDPHANGDKLFREVL